MTTRPCILPPPLASRVHGRERGAATPAASTQAAPVAVAAHDPLAWVDRIEWTAPTQRLSHEPAPQLRDSAAPRWALRGELALELVADGLCGLRRVVGGLVRHGRTVARRLVGREAGQ